MIPEQILQYVFSGITVGSIYALVAIGYDIIYNTTGIINLAQGEFVMLGAMTAYSLSQVMSLLPAILIAVLVTAAVGSLLETVLIRRMKKTSVLGMIVIPSVFPLLSGKQPFISGMSRFALCGFLPGTKFHPSIFWVPESRRRCCGLSALRRLSS